MAKEPEEEAIPFTQQPIGQSQGSVGNGSSSSRQTSQAATAAAAAGAMHAEGTPANSGRNLSFVHDDGQKVKVHIPVSFKHQIRSSLIKTVRNGGGATEAHFTKGDIVIFDPDNLPASRALLEKVDEFNAVDQDTRVFLPIVMPAWVFDSSDAGRKMRYNDAKYDPRHYLEQQQNLTPGQGEAKVAKIVANNGHTNGHRMPYTQIDTYNIVQHLAQTRTTWTGLEVAKELAEKFGRHSASSYQTHLRDNLKSARNYAILVERFRKQQQQQQQEQLAMTIKTERQNRSAQMRGDAGREVVLIEQTRTPLTQTDAENSQEREQVHEAKNEKQMREQEQEQEQEQSRKKFEALALTETRLISNGARLEDATADQNRKENQATADEAPGTRADVALQTPSVDVVAATAPAKIGESQANELIDRMAKLIAGAICEEKLSFDEVNDDEEGFMKDDYAILRARGKGEEAEKRRANNPAYSPPSDLFEDLASAFPAYGSDVWRAFHAKNRKHLVDLALDKVLILNPDDLEAFASQLAEVEDPARSQEEVLDEGGEEGLELEEEDEVEPSDESLKMNSEEDAIEQEFEEHSKKGKEADKVEKQEKVAEIDPVTRSDEQRIPSASNGLDEEEEEEEEEEGRGERSESEDDLPESSNEEDEGRDEDLRDDEEEVAEDLDTIRRRRSTSARLSLGRQASHQRDSPHTGPRAVMARSSIQTPTRRNGSRLTPTSPSVSFNTSFSSRLGGGGGGGGGGSGGGRVSLGPQSPFRRQQRQQARDNDDLAERVYAFRDYYGFASVGACAHLIPAMDVEAGQRTMEAWIDDVGVRYDVAKATVLHALRNTRCDFEMTESILSWYLPRRTTTSNREGFDTTTESRREEAVDKKRRRGAGRKTYAMGQDDDVARDAAREEGQGKGDEQAAGPSKRSRKSVP